MARPVVITGGGTGGHVFPMTAIADALRARGLSSSDLRYVGSRRGQDQRLLGGGDVALTLLPGRGLRRSWRPGAVATNVGALAGLLVAVLVAVVLLRRWRASVVVSVGGYASLAASLAARCWRVPLVLVEFDATPGAAHRVLGRYATARCCAFPSEGANVVVTGAPVREEIERVDRSVAARQRAKATQTPPIDAARAVVVVMTGSLGSRRVNDAVGELVERWRERGDRAVVHVTGRRDYDQVRARRAPDGALDYRVVDFGDMSELWTLADVALCRAGAITVAELSVLAIPAVLVPLPNAPHDHQRKNADAVARDGRALIITDDQCRGETLEVALETLLSPSTLATSPSPSGSRVRPHAAAAIASVVLDVRGTP